MNRNPISSGQRSNWKWIGIKDNKVFFYSMQTNGYLLKLILDNMGRPLAFGFIYLEMYFLR